jgi:hypothetical protein
MPQFDLGFNEGYDGADDYADDDGASGRAVEHLPPPPEIGGSPGYSDIHGSGASVVGGRSTSPRLFTQAAGHPTVNQLRVWKIENGVPVGLGAIDASASEDDLVREFSAAMPRPGDGRAVFKVRPIDGDGREMGMEASVIIGEHHAALQRQRRAASAQTAAAAQTVVNNTLPNDVLRLMERAIDQTRASLDAERNRSRDLMEQIADERMNVASNATTSIQAMSEKMLDAEAQRARMALDSASNYHKQAADNQAAFFQTQMDLMRQERERESDRAERERMGAEERFARTLAEMEMQQRRQQEEADRRRREEREAWERRMEEMRLENQRREQEAEAKRRAEAEAMERRWRMEREEREEQRRREALEREEREAARQRDHEMKMRMAELEQGQQREHAERMMQLQQAQLAATMAQAAGKAGGGIKDTIKEVTGVLAMLGIEPGDLVQRFFAGGGGGDGGAGGAAWAELAGKLMGTVGEVAKAKMIADAHKDRRQIAGPDPRRIAQVDPRMMPPPPGMPMLPPGMQPEDDDEDYEDDEDFDGGMPEGPVRPVTMPRRPVSVARQRLRARRRQSAPAAAPQAPQAAPQAPAEPVAAPEEAPKIRLSVQRLARTALRDLANNLRTTPREGWEGAITLALTSEPAIYHYCQAFSVQAALMEASNGDAELTAAVISALRESPLVPDDLNYGDGGAA